jgi:hypothetical protein
MAAGRMNSAEKERKMVKNCVVFGLAVILPLVIGLDAQARPSRAVHGAIACSDDFQTVEGNAIATPYCQDEYLAKVAREYGSKVTAAELRNRPGLKAEVCRLVGPDNRTWNACPDDHDEE